MRQRSAKDAFQGLRGPALTAVLHHLCSVSTAGTACLALQTLCGFTGSSKSHAARLCICRTGFECLPVLNEVAKAAIKGTSERMRVLARGAGLL